MFSPLKQGDTIGIYSPSKPASVLAKARYERGKARLQALGFTIKEGLLTGKVIHTVLDRRRNEHKSSMIYYGILR